MENKKKSIQTQFKDLKIDAPFYDKDNQFFYKVDKDGGNTVNGHYKSFKPNDKVTKWGDNSES